MNRSARLSGSVAVAVLVLATINGGPAQAGQKQGGLPPITITTTAVPTTTTAAPTTTTTAPPSTSVCNIAPANSATAVSAAIAGCPNGTTAAPTVVKFPLSATYAFNGTVFIDRRSNLTVDLNRSTITNRAPNTYSTYVPTVKIRMGTNVRLVNGTLAGSFAPATVDMLGAYAAELRSNNEWNAGVVVAGGDGVWLLDLTINGVFGDGVMVLPSDADLPAGNPGAGTISRNLHIARVTASGQARQCVAMVAGDGFWVEDVKCKDSWYGGVDVEPDPGVANHIIRNGHILRNTFETFGLYAVAVPFDAPTGQVDGVEIRGNRTLTPSPTCRAPIQTVGAEPGQVPTPESTIANIVVEDNQVLTQMDGIVMRDVASGTVRNNRIEITRVNRSIGWCTDSTYPAEPVRRVNSSNVVVSGNTAVGY